MTVTAASLRHAVVQSRRTPDTSVDFKNLFMHEFISSDHMTNARYKLRRLKQNRSVSKFLSKFWNCTVLIGDIADGEKYDCFVDRLKKEFKIEIIKLQ